MSVRARLALTVFLTGLVTAVGVLLTVAVAFMHFERERTYDRANAFLERVAASQADLLEEHRRDPEQFAGWMRSLLLFEPDCQLYLLMADGTVLASSSSKPLAPGFKVKLDPVQEAAAAALGQRMPYVMGDDPERMNLNAVIAARELRRSTIRPAPGIAGYLYLVSQAPMDRENRLALWRSTLATPALAIVFAVIALATALATWVVATVTRPLRALSEEVDAAARDGFNAAPSSTPMAGRDEFGRLHQGFHQLMATLRAQWDRLRELDRFRREGVSNFSHDLRSPLTAANASLETLQQRWSGDAARGEDAQLVEVALRNTRNAARLVRSLSDLALLDEPEFRLQPMVLDLGEVLDDIVLRFAGRAEALGVKLGAEVAEAAPPPFAAVDIELFERAMANLVDNALKATPRGGSVTLSAQARAEGQVQVCVSDSGRGIAADELPRLFERLYQGRWPAGTDGEGKGLGLAIVRRIVELHGGTVEVTSEPGHGTAVNIRLPAAALTPGAPATASIRPAHP